MTSRTRQRGLGSTRSLLKKHRRSQADDFESSYLLPYRNERMEKALALHAAARDFHATPSNTRDTINNRHFNHYATFAPPSAPRHSPRPIDKDPGLTGWGVIFFILLSGKFFLFSYFWGLFSSPTSHGFLFLGVAATMLGIFFVLANRWRGENFTVQEGESIDVHNPNGPPGGLSAQDYGSVISDSSPYNNQLHAGAPYPITRDSYEYSPGKSYI